MNYISAEQFLKLPEKVQDVFRDWAEKNFKEWDLVYDSEYKAIRYIESVLDTTKESVNVGRVFYLDRHICWTSIHDSLIVPLFRMDQLWDFIEETSKIPVNVKIRLCEYSIELDDILSTELGRDKDKLQAFWKAAVKVAEMKVRGNDEDN